MPQFQYVAKNLQGQLLRSTVDAGSVGALEQLLLEKGFFLEKYTLMGEERKSIEFGNKIKIKEFVVFARQFAVMLTSGMTIVECISVLKDQTPGKKLKAVLFSIHENILKGEMLSTAMVKTNFFPEFFVNMLQVGEASGTLESVLTRMADYYEKDMKLRKKVKGAATYPIMVLIVTVGVIVFLMLGVLPNFVDMLSSMGGELPLITKIVMNASIFFKQYLLVIALSTLGLMIGFMIYIKSEVGRYQWDKAKTKMPLIKSLTNKVVTARFARSLGLLLGSGIPIIKAVEILENLIGNKYIEEKFSLCANEIREGKPISTSLKKMMIFPPLLIQMVNVGENTGELDTMLERSAGFFDEDVENTIASMTSMIEPALIITLALLVGTIVAAVMMPMMSIMKSIGT